MTHAETEPKQAVATDIKPLLWEQYPMSPLSSEEQALFQGLTWINTEVRKMEYPQPKFGISEIVVGEPTQVVMITQGEKGNLVKRIIPEKDRTVVGLGAGPSVPERSVYSNDSFVNFGPADNNSVKRHVVFQKGTDINSKTIQKAIALTEMLQTAIQQDQASRKIKQAERDLIENLGLSDMDPVITEALTQSLFSKLQEAAIESGLIKTSRSELPQKIRNLADEIEKAGIKCIEFWIDGSVYWPDGIRKSWMPETDEYAWSVWGKPRSII
ncbi:MAG: hypothetical protein ABH816_04110 [Candidatus Levyibacteriota bacterium]